MPRADPRPAGHAIKVVARRTGISADVLRAWEKRYRAVVPFRSETGRRLYSEADIEKLLLLRRALEEGHSIGQVAHLRLAELRPLVQVESTPRLALEAAGREPGRTDGGAPGRPGDAGELLDVALEAVSALDQPRLEAALAEGAVLLSRPRLVSELLAPLLYRIGDGWAKGELRPAHEHLASAAVRSFVATMGERVAPSRSAPRLVATTPSGQLHELGALLAASVASTLGWAVTYLGPSLPVEDVVAAVRQLGAKAVALSVVIAGRDPHLFAELRRLKGQLGPEVLLIVGGQAVAAHAAALEQAGAVCARSIADLPSILGARA